MAEILIPHDVNGDPVIFDTVDGYNHVSEHLGGKVSNGFEGGFSPAVDSPVEMSNFAVVDSLIVQIDGTNHYFNLTITADDHPRYTGILDIEIFHETGEWISHVGSVDATNTNSTTFPPKTGWTTSGGESFTLEYDSFLVEDGEFITSWDHDDLLAHPSPMGQMLVKWEEDGADDFCHVPELLFYPQDTIWTPAALAQATRYSGDGSCGTMAVATEDYLGEPILLTNGGAILIHP